MSEVIEGVATVLMALAAWVFAFLLGALIAMGMERYEARLLDRPAAEAAR